MAKADVLTLQADDFPRWYQEVLAKAELADNGPVRGTMVIRPYGYAIWENMQSELDARIKAAGVSNAYFPLFIPESYLHREAEHVEGFSPELAVVTHGGGKRLEEPVVVRPTSETIINAYFSKWIQSYRDLPLLINQWANVVRWELRPRLFLRTTEFLWQEGHTAHASRQDAQRFALHILNEVYSQFMTEVLAIPVVTGRKTERERFAGAITTWTCEGMMRDGKALQMGTSHELGQNFAKVFDITYLDEQGAQLHVWQTSWGSSTRLMGALVMAHGDDRGLRIPPQVAPVQVVVVVARNEDGAGDKAAAIAEHLTAAGLRVRLDNRTDSSFGRRVVDWELKGVPLRVEIGPRDLEKNEAVICLRHDASKQTVSLDHLEKALIDGLELTQRTLFDEALRMRIDRTMTSSSLEEAIQAGQSGFAVVPYDLVGQGGEDILNDSGISVRCLQTPSGGLPSDEDEGAGDLVAIVGRAY